MQIFQYWKFRCTPYKNSTFFLIVKSAKLFPFCVFFSSHNNLLVLDYLSFHVSTLDF